MVARILLIRSLPLMRDARSTKMAHEYRRRGHRVTPLFWGRGENDAADNDAVICTVPGGYGNKWRGLAGRLRWMAFLARWMIRHRHRYDVVHVVDLDTAIIGAPLARILGKVVVYDAFDHIAAILGHGPSGRMLAAVERLLIRKASIAIFPDPIRLDQYGVQQDGHISIIGNIPDATSVPASTAVSRAPHLELVYIGTLEAVHRGLEYLLPLARKYSETLHITVGGSGELHEYFKEVSANLPNLDYIAHQEYENALRFMADADCLYGPYLLSAPAHRYASPNKMYEHLILGKALVTNIGTPPGDLVGRLGSGFLFDGSLEGLLTRFASVDRAACQEAGERASRAWHMEFANIRTAQLKAFFELFDELTNEALV